MTRGRRGARPTAVAAALVTTVALGAAGCGGSTSGDTGSGGSGGSEGSVSVLGTWSGAEQESFMAMVEPWEEETGYTVEYSGSRDLSAQLTAGVASGNLPDVAGLPGPGAMKDFLDQGALKPLDFVDFEKYSASTPPGFAELGQVDGELAGVFSKAAVKGLVYYDTATWQGGEPATLDELEAAAQQQESGDTKAWCVGVESGAASGWPGTDWVEDILLRQSGPEAYDGLVDGELAWTSPEVTAAFETFGTVLDDSHGGPDYVLNTNFGRAANPMFASPPGCLLHHQASFITDFFANEAGAEPGDYDFFPFPTIDPAYADSVTGGGDLIGMFNDTEQARSLVEYLLTPQAQQIWVERGGYISANSEVPLDAYPDEAGRKAAQILADAKTFRFDASDQMPSSVSDAFSGAIVKFVKNQDDLDSILADMDAAQADAETS